MVVVNNVNLCILNNNHINNICKLWKNTRNFKHFFLWYFDLVNRSFQTKQYGQLQKFKSFNKRFSESARIIYNILKSLTKSTKCLDTSLLNSSLPPKNSVSWLVLTLDAFWINVVRLSFQQGLSSEAGIPSALSLMLFVNFPFPKVCRLCRLLPSVTLSSSFRSVTDSCVFPDN